jgi:3-oxoacyl-[acyl-carrier protein] reductase
MDKRPTAGIAGKHALIIGASGGIGKAVAEALAAAGAALCLHGKRQDRLDAALKSCSALGPAGLPLRGVAADLGGGTPPDTLIAEAREADLLVLAYGPFVYKSLEDTDDEDWRRMALVNLALPGILSAHAAKHMAVRGFGRILFFGGTRTDAIRGYKLNAAYAAAKTGLGVLAKSLAHEYGNRGVSCAVLCPGFVDTEYISDTMRESLILRSPRGRLIRPEELGRASLSLLSGGMELYNGAIINADEGLYAL